MSPAVALLASEEHGFPRVSGDEPPYRREVLLHERFSPRERG